MDRFDLNGKVIVITGGAGFLGSIYAKAILESNGKVVILDIDPLGLKKVYEDLISKCGQDNILSVSSDITDENQIRDTLDKILAKFGRLDVLINNATNNPKMIGSATNQSRLENFEIDKWATDLKVGLTGAFICSKIFGKYMIDNKSGKIINISSDLGIIGPDQRLYKVDGLSESEQPAKPVSYSVVKAGLIGLTNYIATSWGKYNVTSNALALGGVENEQPIELKSRISKKIPLGRMAYKDEYCGTIIYLCSDASSYVNGATIVVDGGRTKW